MCKCSSQGAAAAEARPCQTVDTRQALSAFRPPVDNSILTERAVHALHGRTHMQPCSAACKLQIQGCAIYRQASFNMHRQSRL